MGEMGRGIWEKWGVAYGRNGACVQCENSHLREHLFGDIWEKWGVTYGRNGCTVALLEHVAQLNQLVEVAHQLLLARCILPQLPLLFSRGWEVR